MVEGISTPLKSFVDSKRCAAKNLIKYAKMTTDEVKGEDETENSEENSEMKLEVETKIDDRYNGNGITAEKLFVLTEPTTVLSVACTLDAKGRIFRTDDGMAMLLGYISMSELLGIEISKLIPAVQLEGNAEIQYVCALSVRGSSVPVTVKVNTERDPETQRPLMYELQIRAFSSISGIVILTGSGTLYNFNEHFIEVLIGKRKNEALNDITHITDIIPKFHSHILTSPLDETSNEVAMKMLGLFENSISKNCSSSAHSPNNCSSVTCLISDLSISLPKMESIENVSSSSLHSSISDVEEICSSIPSTSSQLIESVQLDSNIESWNQIVDGENNRNTSIIEGSFHGFAKHTDGNLIAICFNIKRLEPSNGASWAVYISYNKSAADSHFSDNMEKEGSIEKNVYDDDNGSICGYNDDDNYQCDFKVEKNEMHTAENIQQMEDDNVQEVAGEYSEYYDTHHLIGNGAFGSVKLATRKDTGVLAVAKFVCKSKIFAESWVPSAKRGNRVVPIELHLLETLSHPNIVKLLDVFENNMYYQLVMEKLGCGMDLFEFIEQQPKLDEPLISYIFKQIVSAVAYLHSKNIVHRDLKDENVIIDQNFSCKLIDFGSAAYFDHNFVFSTFCGTMEYCSPEVLRGNKYRGPELEMWSLGILLYTLVFFENPFRSLQEAMHAEIEFPWEVSEGLFQVIAWLLQRDPQLRATVQEISNHYWIKQSVDLRKYKFQDVLKKYDHPQFDPPDYPSEELVNHLKGTSNYSSALEIQAKSNTRNESNVDSL
ncbi:PAS domain-containing serine/threonine-protein kinase [Dirofilaria immitis]|nr:PAS domain-containing serine/threonine-protein kinase [Dirofilaria immitis]